MELVEAERQGVVGIFVKDMSKAMNIPAIRMFDILGVPKATAERKVAAGEVIRGSGGRAALGMARLLGIARNIVMNSTAPEAKDFDSAKWLGQWLERPQPALGVAGRPISSTPLPGSRSSRACSAPLKAEPINDPLADRGRHTQVRG